MLSQESLTRNHPLHSQDKSGKGRGSPVLRSHTAPSQNTDPQPRSMQVTWKSPFPLRSWVRTSLEALSPFWACAGAPVNFKSDWLTRRRRGLSAGHWSKKLKSWEAHSFRCQKLQETAVRRDSYWTNWMSNITYGENCRVFVCESTSKLYTWSTRREERDWAIGGVHVSKGPVSEHVGAGKSSALCGAMCVAVCSVLGTHAQPCCCLHLGTPNRSSLVSGWGKRNPPGPAAHRIQLPLMEGPGNMDMLNILAPHTYWLLCWWKNSFFSSLMQTSQSRHKTHRDHKLFAPSLQTSSTWSKEGRFHNSAAKR